MLPLRSSTSPPARRRLLVAKETDRLRDAIFVDLEVFFPEAGDRPAALVGHGDIEGHEIRLGSENRLGPLIRLCDGANSRPRVSTDGPGEAAGQHESD